MAAANYVVTPKNGEFAQLSTANTARDGSGTLATVFTAASDNAGSRVDRLSINATGITTSGMIRLFITNSGGTSTRLIQEISVSPNTPSATIPAWSAQVNFDGGLVLENGASLKASTNNAEAFNVSVLIAGDFV
jgi:hypothetical protein